MAPVHSSSRVLMVIADSSRSGGPEHVLTLAQELTAADWAPLVACPPGELVDRCRDLSLAVSPMLMNGRGWASAPSPPGRSPGPHPSPRRVVYRQPIAGGDPSARAARPRPRRPAADRGFQLGGRVSDRSG